MAIRNIYRVDLGGQQKAIRIGGNVFFAAVTLGVSKSMDLTKVDQDFPRPHAFLTLIATAQTL